MVSDSDAERTDMKNAAKSKAVQEGDGSSREEDTPRAYRFASSDNPGMILTVYQLNGDNYLSWSRAMRNALKAKRKLGFIDGTIRKPDEDDPNYEHWEAANSMLIAWITNTLEKGLHNSAACAEDVKILWDDLKERYSQGNLARIYQIKSDICLLKQEGRTVQEYFGKMKDLWDELDLYVESPSCGCGEANSKFVAQRETERSFQFLMGLSSEFHTVRSNILSVEPMPSLNRIYSMVRHEEKQRAVARSHESSSEIAFMAKGRDGGELALKRQFTMDGRPICDHCGMPGHRKASCWALHGYPAETGQQARKFGSSSGGQQGKQSGPSYVRSDGQAQWRRPDSA